MLTNKTIDYIGGSIRQIFLKTLIVILIIASIEKKVIKNLLKRIHLPNQKI